MLKTTKTILVFVVCLLLAPRSSFALTGDVNGGKINPLPIAITQFLAGGGAEESSATLGDWIHHNLTRSGYSSPPPQWSFIGQDPAFTQPAPF